MSEKEFKNRAYSYKTFKLNKSKYELLEAYAIEARNFRNIVSEEIYNNYRQNIFYREINKNKLVKIANEEAVIIKMLNRFFEEEC